MHPFIGHLVAPGIGLGLKVVKVGKGSKRPEIVPDIVDGPFFNFAFFLGLPHVAGDGGNLEEGRRNSRNCSLKRTTGP